MKMKLVEVAGEFCTTRTMPILKTLSETLAKCIAGNEKVEIDTTGVKILTPSFIDELIPPLVIQFGKTKIDSLISFSPPLEGFLAEQIDRGTRLRGGVSES